MIQLSDSLLNLLLSITLPHTGRLARRGATVAALRRRGLIIRGELDNEWYETGYGRMVLARHLHERGCMNLYAKVLDLDPDAAVLEGPK